MPSGSGPRIAPVAVPAGRRPLRDGGGRAPRARRPVFRHGHEAGAWIEAIAQSKVLHARPGWRGSAHRRCASPAKCTVTGLASCVPMMPWPPTMTWNWSCLMIVRAGGAAGVLLDQESHREQRVRLGVRCSGRHVVARGADIQRVPERHAIGGGAAAAIDPGVGSRDYCGSFGSSGMSASSSSRSRLPVSRASAARRGAQVAQRPSASMVALPTVKPRRFAASSRACASSWSSSSVTWPQLRQIRNWAA